MKKSMYLLALAGMFLVASCNKSKKSDESVDQVTNASKILLEQDDIKEHEIKKMYSTINEVPTFKDEMIQNFAKEYASFFNLVIETTETNNPEKIQVLKEQSLEWAQKANELLQEMDPEDAETWNKWAAKLSEKSLSE